MTDGPDIPQYYDDMDAALDRAWRLIARGAGDPASGFRVMQAASVGMDGTPRVRSVILRAADKAVREIRFHTDGNSAKVAELEAHPAIALALYDANEKVQLRLSGEAKIDRDGPVVDAAWQQTEDVSRACYASEPVHGTPIAHGGAYKAAFDRGEPNAGRDTFCVVRVTVSELDWFYLHAAGHRNLRFVWTGSRWQGEWRVP
jgi:pyridoxine/pyridoxamine 5'-phosphate oxidase